MKEIIHKLVFQAIDDYNDINKENPIKKEYDTNLIGEDTVLDSVGLVGLLIDIEGLIQDEFGLDFVIMSEKAMSQKNSPFKSVKSLCKYLEQEIKD